MLNYVTGKTIKDLREKKGYTQRKLADLILVSDKAVSKWETGKGYPDISVLSSLASALGVSIAELLSGECMINSNRCSNMKKSVFYVCPICGNVIHSTGVGSFSCCGITLLPCEFEENDFSHEIKCEIVENELLVTLNHEMSKNHYISFLAYITSDRVQLVKFYPEQNVETRFARCGHGSILAYCNRHGLYKTDI